MDYNSTRERLAMPEYGRLVQDLSLIHISEPTRLRNI